MKSCLVFLSIVLLLIEAAPPQLFYVANEPQPQQSSRNDNNNTTKQTEVNEDLKNQQQIELSDESVEIDDGDLNQESVYYIYHPTGVLQRIVYLAKDDPENMAYTAQFKYENIAPISGPIYTYDPNTLAFQQLVI